MSRIHGSSLRSASRSFVALATTVASGLAIAACSLLISTDGLSGTIITVQGDAAPVTDASAGPGSSSGCACPATGTALCADFEATLGPPWTAFGGAAPDHARAHCGASSLHLHVDAVAAGASSHSGVSETQTFADPRFASGFFARAWFYVPSSSTLPSGNFTELFKAQQDSGDFAGISTQLNDRSLAISNWVAIPNAFEQTAAPLPRDTWTCLEWQVTGGTGGASRLWVGGSPSPSAEMTDVNTLPSPPLGTFFVNIFVSGEEQAQPAFDIWADDVVVDVQRVGCGP